VGLSSGGRGACPLIMG
jgi:hypothetical protein